MGTSPGGWRGGGGGEGWRHASRGERPGVMVMGGVPVGTNVYSRGMVIPEEIMGMDKGPPTGFVAEP